MWGQRGCDKYSGTMAWLNNTTRSHVIKGAQAGLWLVVFSAI